MAGEVICPIPHDASFMQTFHEGWRIVQALCESDFMMPKDVDLPAARFPESRRSPATFEGATAVLSTSDHERKFAADGFGSASEAVGVRSGPWAIAEPAVERTCGERGTRRMRRRL
jgi:hypothetical protein